MVSEKPQGTLKENHDPLSLSVVLQNLIATDYSESSRDRNFKAELRMSKRDVTKKRTVEIVMDRIKLIHLYPHTTPEANFLLLCCPP